MTGNQATFEPSHVGDNLPLSTLPQLQRAVCNIANQIEVDAREGQLPLIDDRAEWARVLCIIIVDIREDKHQRGSAQIDLDQSSTAQYSPVSPSASDDAALIGVSDQGVKS